MQTLMQKQLVQEVREVAGGELDPLLHEYHACENVARELITGLEPGSAAMAAALMDLLAAQMKLTLALVRQPKHP